MDLRIDGKVALVTGIARGQGRTIAETLAREGASIAGFDICQDMTYPAYSMSTPSDLDGLKDYCAAHGVECYLAEGDVRDESFVEQFVATALRKLGSIDILVNNAGVCAYGLAHELTREEWNTVIDVNLSGTWITCKHVLPHMIAAKSGVVINNSSTAGLRAFARLSHYTSAKWGVTGLTEALAIEVAPFNVRVVSIHPTGVDSPMNRGLAELEGVPEDQIHEYSAKNLLPVPFVESQDVANAVAFLASPLARFISGAHLPIDAGVLVK